MKKRHIHFIGIKGVGMTPLAIIAKEAGFIISGCDVEEEFITNEPLRKAGIKTFVGFDSNHLTGVDLVVTTSAHGGYDNSEVKHAIDNKIPILSQGEALGQFMNGKLLDKKNIYGISVAGSHGKTTTTAMIATILKESGNDPTYVIGTSNIPSLGLPGHFGRSKFFVAEADEYITEPNYDKTPKFLWQHPSIAIFTNIELDHPDVYTSVEAVTSAFLLFAKQLPKNGTLIACGDDRQIQKLKLLLDRKITTYGFHPGNDFQIKRISISGDRTFFWVEGLGAELGEFSLRVIGEHNALNALGATLVCLEAGIPLEKIKLALLKFTGTKRRLEYLGKLRTGALVYDDYAHHPTEIQTTLHALRKVYPKYQIVVIFQPHTFSRTKILFDQFIRSFPDADTVILVKIYASLRETESMDTSSELLMSGMKSLHPSVFYLPEAKDVVEYIKQNQLRENCILVLMGAGDIYKVAEQLDFVSYG